MDPVQGCGNQSLKRRGSDVGLAAAACYSYIVQIGVLERLNLWFRFSFIFDREEVSEGHKRDGLRLILESKKKRT